MNDLSREPWSPFELSLIALAVLGVVLPWFAHVRFFASEGRFSFLRLYLFTGARHFSARVA